MTGERRKYSSVASILLSIRYENWKVGTRYGSHPRGSGVRHVTLNRAHIIERAGTARNEAKEASLATIRCVVGWRMAGSGRAASAIPAPKRLLFVDVCSNTRITKLVTKAGTPPPRLSLRRPHFEPTYTDPSYPPPSDKI